MKKSKGLVIILLVVILIIVALAAGVFAMVYTGNLALNDSQKLAKGFKDIMTRFSDVYAQEDNTIEEYEKMYTTPFESQVILSAKVNTIDVEGMEGMEDTLTEIKELIGDVKITNTVQADLNNSLIKENIKLEAADVVESISLDVEYNNDTIALRSEELNEKYLTINRSDAESDSQYTDFVEIFETFETLCEKTDLERISLTEEEKLHFEETYSTIFSNYLTEDMITSTKAFITINKEVKNCSAVTVSLNKQQIQEVIGEYLKTFENDAEGKNIILSKLGFLAEDVTEEDLLAFIEEIRSGLEYLEDDTRITFTIYANNFKTFGFDIEMYTAEEVSKVSFVLENNVINVKLAIDGEEVATGTITKNTTNIVMNVDGVQAIFDITKVNNTNTFTINISENGLALTIVLINEQLSKTEVETSEKYTMKFSLKSEEAVIEFSINADSKFKYLSSVPATTFDSDNSLNMIKDDVQALQNYMYTGTEKAQAILQKAQQNSSIVQAIVSSMELENNTQEPSGGVIDDVTDVTSTQAVGAFNSLYTGYQGTQKGSSIKTLLQAVMNNNQSNTGHLITIALVEGNTITLNTNSVAEIGIAQNDIVNTGEYIVAIAKYDDQGYITTIAIKKNF